MGMASTMSDDESESTSMILAFLASLDSMALTIQAGRDFGTAASDEPDELAGSAAAEAGELHAAGLLLWAFMTAALGSGFVYSSGGTLPFELYHSLVTGSNRYVSHGLVITALGGLQSSRSQENVNFSSDMGMTRSD